VKDLSLFPTDSNIVGLTLAGDIVFFSAEDGVHGLELWKTDGTPEGTTLTKDIYPGTESGLSKQQLGLTALNDILLFWATDVVHGMELWRSDGTEAGTVMVKDITADDRTRPNIGAGNNSLKMKAVNGVVFFSIQANAGVGVELWKSDGTEAGTVRVKEIDPSGGSSGAPNDMFDFNGTLYFSADDGTNGRELWKSDGTEAGTVMVMDINPDGGSSPGRMAIFDGKIFFGADDGVNGMELWSTDGTEANTAMFLDIHFTGSSYPQNLAEIGGMLYFGAADTTTGVEPWISNGEATWGAGTKRFASMSRIASRPAEFTEFSGSVFFSAYGELGTPFSDPGSFWRTDGTFEGTQALGSPPVPTKVIVLDERMYLLSDKLDSDAGNEIWVSDGTVAETKPVSAQYPGTQVGTNGEAAILNGVFITVGFDETHGNELWAYDPAGDGPVLLKNIHAGTMGTYFGSNSGDVPFVEIDGVGYFAAAADSWSAQSSGNELWRSDGTVAGTWLVKDINPGDGSSSPLDFYNVDGVLFFTADDGTHGRELWKSDGTEASTMLVKDITDTNPFDTEFGNFAVVGETLFFSAKNWSIGNMLWKSNGKEEGTVLIKDIYPGLRSLYIREMVAFKGLLFFSAYGDNVVGNELWTSDGTEAGTTLFKDLSESYNSNPHDFIVFGDTLYFIATFGRDDLDLWKTDGTVDGTVMVKDFKPIEGSGPRNLISFKNTLFFQGRDGTIGPGIWTSDGTADGTKMVGDLYPGSNARSVWNLVAGDDFMLFMASESSGVTATQLWRSDGTAAGLRRIEITLPGDAEVEYYSIRQLTRAQGSIYFTTEDEIYGREVWSTDGTDEGTQLLIDLHPGPGDSNPKILGVIGERGTGGETLLFGGDDGFHGNELWKVAGGPSLRPSSFAEWKEEQFTPGQLADPLLSGPDGDPDGDGITNLGEYVHGGSPNRVDANPVGILLSYDAQNEIRGVTVTFPWTRGMTDVGYELQISVDLGSWELLESGVIKVASQTDYDQITLSAEPPDIGATEVFVRLRVFEL